MRCYCFYGSCWPGALPLYALLLASPGRVLTQPCCCCWHSPPPPSPPAAAASMLSALQAKRDSIQRRVDSLLKMKDEFVQLTRVL